MGAAAFFQIVLNNYLLQLPHSPKTSTFSAYLLVLGDMLPTDLTISTTIITGTHRTNAGNVHRGCDMLTSIFVRGHGVAACLTTFLSASGFVIALIFTHRILLV